MITSAVREDIQQPRKETMSTESNFSFTTKVNGDLLTVRGNTLEEFRANLDAAPNIITLVQRLSDAASGNYAKVAATVPAAVAQTFPAATQVADPFESATAVNAVASAPTCAHGARKHSTGTSKAGKAYNGWFCQSRDRDNQCAPIWG